MNAAISRRRFVQGMAAAGALAALPWPLRGACRASRRRCSAAPSFSSRSAPMPINITGRPRIATAHQRPGPGADPALARRRYRDARRHQPPCRAELDPLARHARAHRRWTACRASASTASRPARPSSTASRCIRAAPTGTTAIRRFRSRPGSTARSSSSRKGGYAQALRSRLRRDAVGLERRRARTRSSAISNSRATTTISASARSALSSTMSSRRASPRRSPTG